MKYLIDTNIPLLILLDQDSSGESRSFFERIPMTDCVISDFSLHSIGVILARKGRKGFFKAFVDDLIIKCGLHVLHIRYEEIYSVVEKMDETHLDFDDAYQYTLAERYGLRIVSFDADFDATVKGRIRPAEVANLGN